MKTKLLLNFVNFFASIGKFLLICFLCVSAAFAVVFPFWFFANKAPSVYSVFILLLIFSALIFFPVFSLIRKFKNIEDGEKKKELFNFFRFVLLFILCILSIILPVFFVVKGSRVFALIFLLTGFIIFGVCSFVIKKK